jgi:hypothetical protein
MIKKVIYILLFVVTNVVFAQGFQFGQAKGLFMAVGVGPRFPIGSFAEDQNIGVGFDVTFSYTDNEFLPIFFYSTVGYQHYPGRQDFYYRSDYSSFTSNVILLSPGVRYYFPALLESIVLLMPIVDVGLHFTYFEKLHQFKLESRKQNYLENVSKTGFHIGAGFSMFILDVITYYNYLHNNQFISFNLRANIPIFVKM